MSIVELWTPDDLVRLFKLDRQTVLRLARGGEIPAIKLGKAWRFRPAAIEQWLLQSETAREPIG